MSSTPAIESNASSTAPSILSGVTKNTGPSVNMSPANDYEFIPPPECPVFYPTAEEFALGPLEYISKIRPEAEPHGICKIIPPNTFQPPFCVAVEDFKFTPRIQRLNELEATTRIKLNFIEQIVKFWDLQGSPFKDKIRGASFKIPNLERRSLDLYNLHRIVKEEGGFEICTRDRKWSRVASRMGYGSNASNKGTIASLLRQHYERILFPYDVFQSGATIGPDIDEKPTPVPSDDESKDKTQPNENDKSGSDKDSTPEKRVLRRQSFSPNGNPLLVSPNSQNKELKKLQVYGAGPKMPGYVSDQTVKEHSVKVCVDNSDNTNDSDDSKNWSLHLSQVCLHCGETNPTPMLLTCDNCTNTYHTHCLIPPLNDWPKGVWHCHRCLALLVQSYPQPYTHEFGFVQSQKSYTLSEFGEMADQFKADYFNRPPHSVSLSLAEKEFWRLVGAIEESVTVEYGADLHTNDYGSGFPTKLSKNLLPSDLDYINHSWNLNNIPVLEGSVFRHINANINGMIIPWMYVGMCFATFCWHNEDHWTYSINYLHWGEPKTWYGVPGEHAETFERAMKRAAPELFKSQPDLLHQLVTICNPNILMQDGVPVYRTNQHAGEFVVTFPRAYHTGFNQGLNFAEAVNFAPSDWLPIGRVCITHYGMLHRFPVFSHDELICKMANDPNHLEITLAVETYKDMLRMVEFEKTSRLGLLEWGVTNAKREAFELLQDDERQCDYCKTTCFLSALTCNCDPNKLVCLGHKENLCKTCLPSQHTLRYRYTLDELPIMLHHLRKRAEKFDDWASKVQELLKKIDSNSNISDDKPIPSLKELRTLLNDAVVNRYPTNSDIYEQLHLMVSEANKCSKAAKDLLKQQESHRKQQQLSVGTQQPLTPVKRTLRSTAGRNANAGIRDNLNVKLTLEEISHFYDEIEELQCEIPEKEGLKQLIDKCNSIATSIMSVLDVQNNNQSNESLKSADLESVLNDALSIAVVDFGPQLESFRHKHEEIRWLEECDEIISSEEEEDIKPKDQKKFEISNIKALIESGMKLAVNTDLINSKLNHLQQMVDESIKWIQRANESFAIKHEEQTDSEQNFRKPSLDLLESLEAETRTNPNLRRLDLSPQLNKIQECVDRAHNWINRVNSIFGNENQRHSPKAANSGDAPIIETVEELVVSANGIDCQLEHLANLNSTISAARNWKERLNRTFSKKNSLYSIIQIISPRIASVSQSDSSYSSRTLYHYLKKISSQTQSAKERKNESNIKNQKSLFETQLNGEYSRTHIVALYKLFEEQELNYLRQIRDKNSLKRKYLEKLANELVGDADTDTDPTVEQKPQNFRFCICGKEEDELMIECQLCCDWFHNNCIQNLQSVYMRKKQQLSGQTVPTIDALQPQQHFICDLCSRGRRPKVETILSLLCSLQKLPVRILEGDLLQCLAERAINWQNRAREALKSHPDLGEAHSRVQKLQSDPNFSITQIQQQINCFSETKICHNSDEMAVEEATAQALLQLQRSQPIVSQNPESQSQTASTQASNESNSSVESPLKHKRKSPLVLRVETTPQPLIPLSDESKQLLSELLFEGHCLEVTLEETSHLWSIWLLSQPNYRTVLQKSDIEDTDFDSIKRKSVSDSETQNKKKKINSKEKTVKKTEKSVPKVKKSNKKTKSNDIEELCSMADKCLKPNVAEVNWVQCDGPCSGWFHQLCIGVENPDQIESLEQFFCTNCRNNS